jgi:HD-GYP domain-containing protein (c-di-GMP phosphodiesterase class II)
VAPVSNDSGRRWKSFSRVSLLVSGIVVAIPICVSAAVAFALSHLLPRPHTVLFEVLWWICVLGTAGLAAVGAGRLSRRLLPLAALLNMSMLFPDKAPSRLAVLRKMGSTRNLDRQVRAGEVSPDSDLNDAAIEILTLAAALGQHDRRTRGHSERVRSFADLIADEMRLSQDDRDRLRWSALLHDIGKLTVHPDILNKAGKPTDEEWAALRQHPLEGGRLIAPLQAWLGDWALTVEQHHESFDGKGYPYGLAGNDISLGARIVAVADTFEVMTAVRSYKSASSPADARNELTRCAGSQFDPVVVRSFLNVSLGRLRWIIGPVSWLFDFPFVSQIGNLGRVALLATQSTALTGTLAAGALVAGQVPVQPHGTGVVAATTSGTKSPVAGHNAPAISMQLSSSAVALGGSVYDTAHLSGVSADAGGTMTYAVYDNASCASDNGGLVATLGPVAVTDGDVADSPPWTPTGTAGTYYFVASYSGAAENSPTVSGCAGDPITVSPQTPTIVTQLSATSTTLGQAVHDTAVLVGASANAGGTVTYDVFDNANCASSGILAPLAPVTVSGGRVPDSPDWTPSLSGTYYFVASYSGDGNNSAVSSSCDAEPITVSIDAPTPTPEPTTAAPSGSTAPPPASPTVPTPPVPTPPTVPTPPPPPTPPLTVSPSTSTISTQLSASSVAIGGSAYDTAVLSGASTDAGGSVSYAVYDNSTCISGFGGLVATLGPVTVTDGAVPASPGWTATGTAGTYYFVASYSGDADDNAAASGCSAEPIAVTQDTPTISTQLSATSVAFGATAFDTALLTGTGAGAGGSVTYRVYDNATCASGFGGLVATLGPVTVTNGSVPNSSDWTASGTPGTYYFVASYSGDADDASATGGCSDEPITVTPDAPSISTQLSATTVAIGGTVDDTAAMVGSSATAGGMVTYSVYGASNCTTLLGTLGPVTVTNGSVPASPDWTATGSAGTDYFVASYSGDTDNASATSGCAAEPVTVSQDEPGVSATVSSPSVVIGATVYSTATLSGSTATAGGTVSYSVYGNANCSGLITILGPVTVTNGAVPTSPDWTAIGPAQTDYFVDSYSGDSNNASASSGCAADPFTVSANVSTVTTQASSPSVSIGSAVYDTATLSGSTPNAGGTMTYDIYSSANCSGLISTLGVETVTNGSAPDSPDWTAVGPAGTVYFVASYSGDVNNASAVSGCAADPVSVNQNAPSISTSLSAATVGIGGSVDDTATLSGSGASAGGTVTYDVYSGATCAALVATLGPVTVTNGVVPNSPDWTPTSAGTDYFVASYSGDANNAPAASGCAAEPVTVSPNAPTISTVLSVTTVTLGGTVYDAATLAAATTSAGGTVTYRVYSGATCSGLITTLGPLTVTNGSVPNSPTWTATSAGTYYFVASYSGDANNTAAVSACGAEPISVTTTSVIAGSLALDNGSGTSGRADEGDTIVVTYTTPPTLSRFCSAWSSGSYPELGGSGVVVTATENAGGDGMIASVSDSSGCTGGFHFGSIDLGQGGYFSGTVTFGGPSLGCLLGILNVSCSSIQWNGVNTLTITLGAPSTGNPTQSATSVAVYTPDAALGYTGTISSVKQEHF